ncbi:MAG TPA: hypothetical protein VEL79_22430 [Vicinamibacterales bacterium]|nr:hypothetical protein [Vicinamibacterales bacterium]
MTRVIGAAVGAVIVLLFLAALATRLSARPPVAEVSAVISSGR